MTPLTRTVSVLSLFTLLGCSTTPIQTTDQWGNPKFSMAIEDPIEATRHSAVSERISFVGALSMLSGRFVGTGPDNQLMIDLERVRDPKPGRVSLLLTVSGSYRGTDVRRSGLVRLAGPDGAPRLAYYPDFEPGASTAGPRLAYYPDFEPSASTQKVSLRDRPPGRRCAVVLKPEGEGFSAEPSCDDVLPGQWALEIGAAGIRLENVRSGKSLQFTRVTG